MHRILSACLVGSLVVVLTSASPVPEEPFHQPQHLDPVYHPAPAPHKPEPVYHAPEPKHSYKAPPKPYNYAYGVNDPYQGLDFGQTEESDGNKVGGSYTVQLPDGRKQIVKYVADHDNGFHAEVTYEGKAQYPPKSDKKPFVVEPSKGYHEPEAPSYGH